MRIEDLEKMLSLAQHGQVTDAATALGMPQPTLSRALGRVEAELGVRLFERVPHGLVTNPYGAAVLAAADDLARRYAALRDQLAGMLDPDSGTIRLSFLDSLATTLVPRLLHDFRAEAPGLTISLRQEPGHELLRDLAAGVTELAILSPRPAAAEHGWVPLQRQRIVVVVPADHRWAGRRRVRPADLAEEDLITAPSGFSFRGLVDDLLADADVAAQIAFESADLAAIEGLVGAGLGIALLPEHLAGVSGTRGLVLEAGGAQRTVGLTWRTDRDLAAPAARFLEFVRRRRINPRQPAG